MADPFPKSKQLARGERRYRRRVASPKQWAAIRADKLYGNYCAIEACANDAETLHHLVPRSMGGDDVADNLVGLCGNGSSGCHGLVTENDPGTLAALAASLRESEVAYVVSKLGESAMQRLFGV
jgi:5-methylcytosine-specific restriction endonuclease McrA